MLYNKIKEVFSILIQRFSEIEGEYFPSKRLTKVLVGPKSNLKANNFVMGSVKIDPNGSIPKHCHDNEEIYIILRGNGRMVVEGESKIVEAESVVYIPPNKEHYLENNTDEPLEMMFVYSPATIVDHWEKERRGELS